MPPSLRRTSSSPSVRPSPYSRSLSYSHHQHHHPRRSSGSDTLHRRVLADIDWWLVPGPQRTGEDELLAPVTGADDADGSQSDAETEPDTDAAADANTGVETGAAGHAWQTGFDLDLHGASAAGDLFVDFGSWSAQAAPSDEPSNPLRALAALSIAPSTPTRRSRNASDSSTDSSPEQLDDAAASSHARRSSMDALPPPPELSVAPAVPHRLRPRMLARSFSMPCAMATATASASASVSDGFDGDFGPPLFTLEADRAAEARFGDMA